MRTLQFLGSFPHLGSSGRRVEGLSSALGVPLGVRSFTRGIQTALSGARRRGGAQPLETPH